MTNNAMISSWDNKIALNKDEVQAFYIGPQSASRTFPIWAVMKDGTKYNMAEFDTEDEAVKIMIAFTHHYYKDMSFHDWFWKENERC